MANPSIVLNRQYLVFHLLFFLQILSKNLIFLPLNATKRLIVPAIDIDAQPIDSFDSIKVDLLIAFSLSKIVTRNQVASSNQAK